jgi:SWI/SNF-related matrix-associated actin-dependent regulator of chromatin subfamily B protein 1
MGMGNISPMAQVLAQQQHHQLVRQQSLPLGASPMSKEPGSVNIGGMRTSVPPAIPGPNVTGPVARAPSTASVTPVSGPPASGVPPSTASGGNTLPASDSVNSNASTSSVPGQIPSLPTNVQLNPAITQVTNVPLIDSLKLIPDISDEQMVEIKGWLKTDKEYEVVMRKMKERMASEMRGLFGGAMWWEKAAPDVDVNRWKRGRENFDVRYPLRHGKEKEGRDRRKRQREGLRLYVRLFIHLSHGID